MGYFILSLILCVLILWARDSIRKKSDIHYMKFSPSEDEIIAEMSDAGYEAELLEFATNPDNYDTIWTTLREAYSEMPTHLEFIAEQDARTESPYTFISVVDYMRIMMARKGKLLMTDCQHIQHAKTVLVFLYAPETNGYLLPIESFAYTYIYEFWKYIADEIARYDVGFFVGVKVVSDTGYFSNATYDISDAENFNGKNIAIVIERKAEKRGEK